MDQRRYQSSGRASGLDPPFLIEVALTRVTVTASGVSAPPIRKGCGWGETRHLQLSEVGRRLTVVGERVAQGRRKIADRLRRMGRCEGRRAERGIGASGKVGADLTPSPGEALDPPGFSPARVPLTASNRAFFALVFDPRYA